MELQGARGSQKRKIRKLSSGQISNAKRSLSEGSKAPQKNRYPTRESSAGGIHTTPDVRCACQYYQCPSLLPDRVSLVGTRPLGYAGAATCRDHEYEPVNPPQDNFTQSPEVNPTIYITDTDYDTSILPLGTVTIEPVVQNKDKKLQNDPLRKTENISQLQGQSNIADLSAATAKDAGSQSSELSEPERLNFQAKLRRQSENLKAKFQNIKKPKFNKPEFKKPEFKKFKIEKPKFNIPKIPDTAKINLPSFSLGRKHSEKRSLKDRKLSTEANDGDTKKQFFDFSTYPRIFKKKQKAPKKEDQEENVNIDDIPAFATAPRTKKNGKKNGKKKEKWGGAVSMRIPLHSEDSMDQVEQDDQLFGQNNEERDQESYLADEGNSNRPLDSSHIRYDEDIDIDDEYDHDNNEIERERDFVDRWNKGMFNQNVSEMEYLENFKNSNYKVTDLDSPDDKPNTDFEAANNETNDRYAKFEQTNNQNNNRYTEFDTINNGHNTRYSSGSSLGHRRGVLEEIDSDEFIWRPKGISQEHINMFASPEMREAFQPPINTLLQMEKIQDTNLNDSRRSLPEEYNKRKQIKKPKRVKTPHTSNDRIAQSEELTDDLDALPPPRPKRRSRRKKNKNQDDIIPYRETIPVEDDDVPTLEDRLNDHRESLGILGDDERDEESILSENDKIEARLQEEILSNQFQQFQYADDDDDIDDNKTKFPKFDERYVPPVPPRKPKSIKSLNLSENDSLFDDIAYNRAVSEDLSIGRNDNELGIEAIRTESKIIIPIHQDLPPRKPTRTRSRNSSQLNLVQPLNFNENGYQEACVEPMCVQDMRDPMGYAIIDKTKSRDPPLPPPRLPPRPKRSTKLNEDTKFFTVPRSSDQSVPVRPLRNYSTLGQMKKSSDLSGTYENKENIDIIQYVEIEDEPSRDLQSGEVIKKMKDRPLPPPPRPPRKCRPLKDITSMENIPHTFDTFNQSKFEETEVSTQTEPLPDDFICDELVQEPTDKIIIPSTAKDSTSVQIEEVSSPIEQPNQVVEKRLITPTSYTYEETITHGSILIEPLNGAKILPDYELQHTSKERLVPISKLSDDETSSIPEEFKKLSDSHHQQSDQPQKPNIEPVIPEVIKTQKLQVADLDVDTLSVNKLIADKIICSNIESDNIQTTDINSKNASLKIGDISLPPGVIEEIIRSLASREPSHETKPQEVEEKKTPITEHEDITQEELKHEDIIFENPELSEEIVDTETYTHSPDKEASVEHLENLNISDENILPETQTYDVSQHSSNSEEPPELVQIKNLEIEDTIENLQENSETIQVEIKTVEEEKPPIPPPRANSEHAASRLSKQTNQTATSTTEGINLEPEVDDEPPPRPPEPQMEYIPSQPPPSFYALKAQKYVDDNIPVAPRRKRHTRSRARSRSSSEDSSPTRVSRRFPRRYSEIPLAQLSGQLIRACGSEINHSLKRLITYLTSNVLGNVDGSQDLNVMILIVLVLIAGLILLGYGSEKTVVHLHHWEYFNPPRDL